VRLAIGAGRRGWYGTLTESVLLAAIGASAHRPGMVATGLMGKLQARCRFRPRSISVSTGESWFSRRAMAGSRGHGFRPGAGAEEHARRAYVDVEGGWRRHLRAAAVWLEKTGWWWRR